MVAMGGWEGKTVATACRGRIHKTKFTTLMCRGLDLLLSPVTVAVAMDGRVDAHIAALVWYFL